MASLMEELLKHADDSQDWEEFLDSHAIDRFAVSSVEGGWERIETDPFHPRVEGLMPQDFRKTDSSVYEASGYMIVRGVSGGQCMWFVFESASVHS